MPGLTSCSGNYWLVGCGKATGGFWISRSERRTPDDRQIGRRWVKLRRCIQVHANRVNELFLALFPCLDTRATAEESLAATGVD